jgi:hypothetical protein
MKITYQYLNSLDYKIQYYTNGNISYISENKDYIFSLNKITFHKGFILKTYWDEIHLSIVNKLTNLAYVIGYDYIEELYKLWDNITKYFSNEIKEIEKLVDLK